MAYVDTAFSEPDSWHDSTWQPRDDKVFEILRRAQRVHPDNGALWLAEGEVLLAAGREAAGLEALRLAARKGGWDGQTKAAFFRRFDLFVANGLPPREAAHEAFGGSFVAWRLVSRLAHHFEDEMSKAIVGHDDARFSALLAVLMELAQPTWGDDEKLLLHRFCVCKLYLEPAMFERLKQEFPDQWRSTPTDHMMATDAFDSEAVRNAYLAAYAGRQAANESAEICAAARRACRKAGPIRGYFDPYQLERYMCGFLAFLLQAFIIAIFLLHLPSRFFHPDALVRGWLPRNASFWVPAVAALVLGTGLLTSAFVAVSSITGHSIGLVGDALLGAMVVTAVWLGCKLSWLSEHGGFRLVPMAVVVLGFVYLAAVGATAYFRAELLHEILANFPA